MEKKCKPSLNLVIPVYNEEKELAEKIAILWHFLDKNITNFSWEITIVDNASTDRTFSIANNLAKSFSRISTVHLRQKGRGRAVKYVWIQSKHDMLAYMDLDLSTDLKHFPKLLKSLERGCDIAIGSRNTRNSRVYGRNIIRTITSKGYILLIKLIFQVNFSDSQCGFKAVKRNIANKLVPMVKDNEWFFDTELLLLAEKLGYHICEEPVMWVDNPGSTVRVFKTIMGDLCGLWRLFIEKPWEKMSSYART